MALWYMMRGIQAILQILWTSVKKDINNSWREGDVRDEKEKAYNIAIALACFTFFTAIIAIYSIMNRKAGGCLGAMGLETISMIIGIVYIVICRNHAMANFARVWGIIVLFFQIYIIYVWYSLYDYFNSEGEVMEIPSQNVATNVIVVQPQQPQPYVQQPIVVQQQQQPQPIVLQPIEYQYQQPQPYVAAPQVNYQVNV
jgi:hypothetical protein